MFCGSHRSKELPMLCSYTRNCDGKLVGSYSQRIFAISLTRVVCLFNIQAYCWPYLCHAVIILKFGQQNRPVLVQRPKQVTKRSRADEQSSQGEINFDKLCTNLCDSFGYFGCFVPSGTILLWLQLYLCAVMMKYVVIM